MAAGIATGSTPHNLVPDMVGLTARCGTALGPGNLVVQLRRILPLADRTVAGGRSGG
jgi:hypothetical protein